MEPHWTDEELLTTYGYDTDALMREVYGSIHWTVCPPPAGSV